MDAPSRVVSLVVELLGLDQFVAASVAAGGWLSPTLVLRGLCAIWLVACMLTFAVRVVRLTLPAMGVPLRWCAIVVVGLWTSTVGFHVLRMFGLFELPVACLSAGVMLWAAIRVAPQHAAWRWSLTRELRAARAVLHAFRRSKYVGWNALFVACASFYALRALIVPPLGWDALTYHGPRAVEWVTSGHFSFGPGPSQLDIYRLYFAGAEVLAAWSMLPFHSDLLYNLTSVVSWLGVGLGVWALARTLRVPEPFASSSACVVLLMPVLVHETSSGYVEAPLNAALMTGLALSLQCLKRPSFATMLIAAAGLGVAAGIKLPGSPPGLIVFSVLALRYLRERDVPVRRRAGAIGASALLIACPIMPWVVQAWLETGYPLSPMPIRLFGLTLGVSSFALQWVQSRPALMPHSWASETAALRTLFAGVAPIDATHGPPLYALALVPLFGSVCGLVWLARRQPLLAAAVGAALVAPLWLHFSGSMSVVRLHWTYASARMLISALALAVPLSFACCRPASLLSRTYRRSMLTAAFLVNAASLTLGCGAWELSELVLLALGVIVLGTGLWWMWRWPRSVTTRTMCSLLLVAWAACVLQLRRDQTRPQAYETSWALHDWPRYWTLALDRLCASAGTHRIAVTAGPLQDADHWYLYPLYGARLENTLLYVTPTRDGGIAQLGPSGDLAARADYERWLARLTRQGVTEVMTFMPRSLEQTWMDAAPERFMRLAGDQRWGLYRVRSRPEPSQ